MYGTTLLDLYPLFAITYEYTVYQILPILFSWTTHLSNSNCVQLTGKAHSVYIKLKPKCIYSNGIRRQALQLVRSVARGVLDSRTVLCHIP